MLVDARLRRGPHPGHPLPPGGAGAGRSGSPSCPSTWTRRWPATPPRSTSRTRTSTTSRCARSSTTDTARCAPPAPASSRPPRNRRPSTLPRPRHHHQRQRHGHRRARAAPPQAPAPRRAQSPSSSWATSPRARAAAGCSTARSRSSCWASWSTCRRRSCNISGFSAHADWHEMLRWMEGFTAPPKQTLLVHGEDVGPRVAAPEGGRQGLAVSPCPRHLRTVELVKA